MRVVGTGGKNNDEIHDVYGRPDVLRVLKYHMDGWGMWLEIEIAGMPGW